MESKKHYNLSTTEDNGQSITTTNTSTEHPAEILRMMQLAGMETAHMVHQEAIEEEVDSEFKPTPANDKLDLDDYSKKSPESIAKQKKSIQPTLGDNPLEYSLDENEIYEAMIEEFDKPEEKLDELAPLLVPAVKAALNTQTGQKLTKKVGDTISSVKNSADDVVGKVFNKGLDLLTKDKKVALNKKFVPSPHTAESIDEELTAGQKKLPDGLQKAILAKQGKKDETKETEETSVDSKAANAVSENSYEENNMEDKNNEIKEDMEPHVNGSQETEDIERIIRPYWNELPEGLQLDLEMHFDDLKGEFDEAQESEQSQERIKKLINF